MTKINELKSLELMASPYNQSLIAMIKVELDISRKMKELKKMEAKSNHNKTKSKFSLPKHLSTQNSNANFMRVEEELKIDENSARPLQEHSSDARLTSMVNNLRPKAMTSCRSNNDVAPRNYTRSPRHNKKN